jgi:hypothetical protein
MSGTDCPLKAFIRRLYELCKLSHFVLALTHGTSDTRLDVGMVFLPMIVACRPGPRTIVVDP